MDYEGMSHLSDVEQSGVEHVNCKAQRDCASDFYHTAVLQHDAAVHMLDSYMAKHVVGFGDATLTSLPLNVVTEILGVRSGITGGAGRREPT